MYMDIEQKRKILNEEYKAIEQENREMDIKSQTIDNMRLNYILNNKYENKVNNFDDIGLKTMPNFGNNINYNFNNTNNSNYNRAYDIKPKNNFAQTFSIFNQGSRKFNADDYFDKIKNEIKEQKKENGNNDYDIESYLFNGKNFLKDKRDELKALENK